ncbi:MAG TPA: hypothetical protein VFW78_11280 [Bacteroidia bacterium]|nr:hypothetical protein [Bacteroidia bacterium]
MKTTTALYILIYALTIVMLKTNGVSAQTPDSVSTKPDTLLKSTVTASGQQNTSAKPQRSFGDMVSLGIGTGFWVNTRETYVEVAPLVAYRFPKRLTTGIGYRYIYRHDRVFNRDLNSYGPNAFARLDLTRRLYFWTEYETLKTDYLTEYNNGEDATKDSHSVDSWFTGFGYIRQLGRKARGGLSFQVLYNVLYDKDDLGPYYYPITYRVGYFF